MSSRTAFCRALTVLAAATLYCSAATMYAAPLTVAPSRASFNPIVPETVQLELQVQPVGPAERFVQQPAMVQICVDGVLAREMAARGCSIYLSVPVARLSPGSHVIAVNWSSAHGPLAANALLLNAKGNLDA